MDLDQSQLTVQEVQLKSKNKNLKNPLQVFPLIGLSGGVETTQKR